MSDIGEGIGSAVEGGLLARTVGKTAGKGRAGRGGDGRDGNQPDGSQAGQCLNCGTSLAGNHCHNCGQAAYIHRTLSAIWHDILHGVLHLDGKFWRTLPLLIFKPGQLTRRYINGERAKFISPMAMFLFSIFMMFAIFQALGISAPSNISSGLESTQGIEKVGLAAREETGKAREDLIAQLQALPENSPRRAAIEEELEGLDQADNIIGTAEDIIIPGSEGAEAAGTGQAGSQQAGSGPKITARKTGVKWLDEGIISKWHENPSLMLYKMQNNAYKFSWLLIPLSVPFVWLLFAWRRQFKAYDHAIFVTYSLSFMSLLFITLSILVALDLSSAYLFLLLVIIPPLHLYKHLRGTYMLSRFSTLWRLVLLGGFINTIITLFLQILFLMGAF